MSGTEQAEVARLRKREKEVRYDDALSAAEKAQELARLSRRQKKVMYDALRKAKRERRDGLQSEEREERILQLRVCGRGRWKIVTWTSNQGWKTFTSKLRRLFKLKNAKWRLDEQHDGRWMEVKRNPLRLHEECEYRVVFLTPAHHPRPGTRKPKRIESVPIKIEKPTAQKLQIELRARPEEGLKHHGERSAWSAMTGEKIEETLMKFDPDVKERSGEGVWFSDCEQRWEFPAAAIEPYRWFGQIGFAERPGEGDESFIPPYEEYLQAKRTDEEVEPDPVTDEECIPPHEPLSDIDARAAEGNERDSTSTSQASGDGGASGASSPSPAVENEEAISDGPTPPQRTEEAEPRNPDAIPSIAVSADDARVPEEEEGIELSGEIREVQDPPIVTVWQIPEEVVKRQRRRERIRRIHEGLKKEMLLEDWEDLVELVEQMPGFDYDTESPSPKEDRADADLQPMDEEKEEEEGERPPRPECGKTQSDFYWEPLRPKEKVDPTPPRGTIRYRESPSGRYIAWEWIPADALEAHPDEKSEKQTGPSATSERREQLADIDEGERDSPKEDRVDTNLQSMNEEEDEEEEEEEEEEEGSPRPASGETQSDLHWEPLSPKV
jgi:hypothetical protein